MSPEIWASRPYDAKSDMWALGCLLYEMAMLRCVARLCAIVRHSHMHMRV